MSVHLPLAALLLAAVIFSWGVFFKNPLALRMGGILTIIGTVGAWFSIYTGDLADGIVSRTLCDPTVLKTHENYALTATWIFSMASLLILLDLFKILAYLRYWANILVVLLLISGAGLLIYVGSLGSELVYEQAAGVSIPSEDCSEFD
ncbi:MAG: hypothetical protein R3277_03635 [Brumimicrobium sp.]|nr:hypothetical protein [Brumimicrobium sp.]